MNISLVFSKVYLDYGLDQQDIELVRERVLAYVEPILIDLHSKYSFEARSPTTLNRILADLKGYFFKDMFGVKLVIRHPKGARLDLGSILNYCKLIIDGNEFLLTDYILHYIIIEYNKAFKEIK